MSMTSTEKTLRERAIDHDCPECGAKAGVRCRVITPNVTNPKRVKVDVQRKPCAERASLAWSAMLAEM